MRLLGRLDDVDRRYQYAMNARVTDSLDQEPPDDRDETIAELRAVLAPLLDNPFRDLWTYSDPDETCVFCEHVGLAFDRQSHEPGCPVLRRDELLGR